MRRLTRQITLSEKYGAAMKITDQAEADDYFEKCVRHCMAFGKSRAEAEAQERNNIGYWAGYEDSETRRRVETLFKCEHPVFGSIAVNGPPTQQQAFEAGLRMGDAARVKAARGGNHG